MKSNFSNFTNLPLTSDLSYNKNVELLDDIGNNFFKGARGVV